LIGSCKLANSNLTLTLKNYECGIDGAIKTLNQLNTHCLTLSDYDCAQSPDLDYNPVETFTTPQITQTTLLTSATFDLTTLPIKQNLTVSKSVSGDDDDDDGNDGITLDGSINQVNKTRSNSNRLIIFSIFYLIVIINLLSANFL
jgi:hypothetical protein